MKFRIFIFMFTLLSSQALYSQKSLYLGVNGGITYSNCKVQSDILVANYDYKLGYAAGLTLERTLKSHFVLMTTIDYYQNGYNQNYNSTIHIPPSFTSTKSYFSYENRITQQYLNNSWLLGFHTGNKMSVSAYAGIFWAVFLGANSKMYDCIYIDPEEAFEISDPALPAGYHKHSSYEKMPNSLFSDFDCGIASMIRLEYHFSEKVQATISTGYKAGLISTSTSYLIDKAFTRSFDLRLGLITKLK